MANDKELRSGLIRLASTLPQGSDNRKAVLNLLRPDGGVKAAEDDKEAKFEKGKPADPTKNMSPEQKAEWNKQKELHKDKFKSAGLRYKDIRTKDDLDRWYREAPARDQANAKRQVIDMRRFVDAAFRNNRKFQYAVDEVGDGLAYKIVYVGDDTQDPPFGGSWAFSIQRLIKKAIGDFGETGYSIQPLHKGHGVIMRHFSSVVDRKWQSLWRNANNFKSAGCEKLPNEAMQEACEDKKNSAKKAASRLEKMVLSLLNYRWPSDIRRHLEDVKDTVDEGPDSVEPDVDEITWVIADMLKRGKITRDEALDRGALLNAILKAQRFTDVGDDYFTIWLKKASKTARLHRRHEKILQKYVDGGGTALDWDALPDRVRAALSKVKYTETLWMDVNRWLDDNHNAHLNNGWDTIRWASGERQLRSGLIRLASTLPKGSEDRKAVLNILRPDGKNASVSSGQELADILAKKWRKVTWKDGKGYAEVGSLHIRWEASSNDPAVWVDIVKTPSLKGDAETIARGLDAVNKALGRI